MSSAKKDPPKTPEKRLTWVERYAKAINERGNPQTFDLALGAPISESDLNALRLECPIWSITRIPDRDRELRCEQPRSWIDIAYSRHY